MSINLPQIRRFTGEVPDRARMDRQTFAEATYYYLRYINDTFVVDAENLRDALNTQLPTFLGDLETIKTQTTTLRDETQTFRNDAENFKNAAQSLKDETQTLHDETQTFRNDAANYKTLAQNYANADEDVEVETGQYSAKHWAIKAQSIANDTAAILPDGAINDSAVSANSTWSSQKLDNDMAKVDLSNVAASAILDKVKTVDGSGSGLNADLLDGREASSFANASHTHQISDVTGLQDALDSKADATTTNSSLAAKEDKANKVTSWSSSPSDTHYPSERLVKTSLDAKANASNVYSKSTVDSMLVNKADKNLGNVSATDVLNKVKSVDGSGSGLDADLLDGHDSSYFAKANDLGQQIKADTVYVDNWFRAYGACGLYFQDHGGGFRMTDNTWIRTYGGKRFYCDNIIRADGGFQVDGKWIASADGNTLYEGGTALSSKYLGKTAKAADSAKLNGLVNSTSASANTIAQRDGSGDIFARLFRTTYGAQTTPPAATAEFFFRNNSSDNYIRPLSAQAFLQWLQNQGVGMAIKNTFTARSITIDAGSTVTLNLGFTITDREKVWIEASENIFGFAVSYGTNDVSSRLRFVGGFVSPFTYFGETDIVGYFGHFTLYLTPTTLKIKNTDSSYAHEFSFIKIVEFS